MRETGAETGRQRGAGRVKRGKREGDRNTGMATERHRQTET